MAPPADNLLGVVGSATLFVTTVLLSQWIQNNRWIRGSPPVADASSDDEDDPAGLSAEIMQWYALRRSEDRLSFQNLNSRAVHDDLEGDDLINDCAVYPRNKNWTHFEKESFDVDTCNDRTHTHGGPKGGSTKSGSTNGFNGSIKGVYRSIEGDDHDYANTLLSRTDSDRFVWTPRGSGVPRSSLKMSTTAEMSSMAGDPTPTTLLTDPATSLNRAVSLDVARSTYNARIMPNTLTLIRHGQSIGNLDEKLYATTADNAMPLTKLGWEQAKQAGRCLKERILRDGSDGGVHFIVSPYVRTVETFHGIVSAWCHPSEFDHIADRDSRMKAWYSRLLELGLTWHEDPRIREQGT
jgi:hypothetical protein